MKPFLGINLTTDKKNDQPNGSQFMVQATSSALSDALERSMDRAEQTIETSKLPLPLRAAQFICGIAALLIASSILRADVSLAEGYHNAPWLYWLAGVCAVVWLVLWLWSGKKAKTVLETDQSAHTFSHLDSVSDAVYAELGVPADAKEVDVLSFFYKVKDGNLKVCEKGMQITQYFNPVFKVFADTEHLYLANLEGKYAFPLSSIVKIHTVNKRIRIESWNKEEPFNKGIYKQYKLSEDQYDCIHCKDYHILEFNHKGESWGIYFPCYELPVFEELTGLKTEIK